MPIGESAPSPRPRDVEETLRKCRILDLAPVGIGSNAVFLASLELPGGEGRGIYKPRRGERPLWDFPRGTLYLREVAAFEVDRALGWGLLPTTVMRRDGPLGPGSLQEFVEGPDDELEVDKEKLERDLIGLAVLDVVINNADRKSQHLLVDSCGHLKGIDHGVTFNKEFKLRTVLAELGGQPIPEFWLHGLRALWHDRERVGGLTARLRPLLAPDEIRALEGRSLSLLSSRHFPQLHPWYGRPFEW